MKMRVKYLKTGTFNASLVTGGPYIKAVEGVEDIIDNKPAGILHDRGVVEILGVVEKAEERETKDVADEGKTLSRMNLEELRVHAVEKGVEVTDEMTKAQIKDAIDAPEDPGTGGGE